MLLKLFRNDSLVILLLSTATQATEYREVNKEVKASEILKHIENGEDIYLENCSIVGELNISAIKLKTVPNPDFYKLLNEEDPKEVLVFYGINENRSIVQSNIKIKNSFFENGLDLSCTTFNAPIDFDGTTFNDSADFNGSNFNASANLSRSTFNIHADFAWTTFNAPTYFSWARIDTWIEVGTYFNNADFTRSTFNAPVNFEGSAFNDFANFACTTFNDSVRLGTDFYAPADFTWTTFNAPVNFEGSAFNDFANFAWTTFNDSGDFEGPETFKKIITSDEKTCDLFRKFYKNEARYDDADKIYYDYRKFAQDNKDWTLPSKWMDFLSWATCGYGLRLSHTIWCGVLILLFFTYVYNRQYTTVSVVGIKNKVQPIRVYWKESGIYRLSDEAEKKSPVSLWECLYFSINTFTGLGSSDWHARDNFRKWVTFEGLLGWVMLGIFMATLANILIRS